MCERFFAVEVFTFFKEEFDCEENPICTERVNIYQNHKEDNEQLDEIIFDISDPAVISQFSTQFSELTFGPAGTLMIVQ